MARIKWLSIILKGFGSYRDGVQVDLTDGLNILTAPNEAGKSTLVAGLRAVLFGLPNTSNPNNFGTDRFRSWEETDAFEGEVVFAVDDQPYRVKRNFHNHRVELAQLRQGQWQEIFSGEHNPRAHKDSGVYPKHLKKLVGINTGEGFINSFCVEQPLPEGEQLSEHVQSLLSGSGGHFGKALEHLKNELSEITRFLKPHGFPRDNNKDRKLEELQQRIGELEREIEEGQVAVNRLQSVLAARTELEKELDETTKILAQKKRLKEAWMEARQLYDRYRDLLSRQLELKDAGEQLRSLKAAIDQKRQEIEERYTAFTTEPGELPEALDKMIDMEEDEQELIAELDKLEKALADQEQLLAGVQEELTALEVFSAKNHLLADFREYQKLHQEYETLLNDLKGLNRDKSQTEEELAKLPPWGSLGDYPVMELDNLSQASQRMLRLWQNVEEYERELGDIRQEIENRYHCFQGLNEAQEEALADYRALKLQLETNVKEKERAHQEAQEEQRRHQQAQAAKSNRQSALITASTAIVAAVLGWIVGQWTGLSAGVICGAVMGWGIAKLVVKKSAGSPPAGVAAIPTLQKELAAARQALAEFHALLQHQEAVFGDELPKRYGIFKELRQREEELLGKVRQIMQEEFQAASLEATPPNRWPDPWRKLALLGNILGRQLNTLPQLMEWLANLNETTWREMQHSCQQWETLHRRLVELDKQEQDLQSPQELEDELAVLQEKVAPYRLETPIEQVEADFRRYQDLREERSGIFKTMEQLRNDLTAAVRKKENLTKELTGIKETYQAYLELGKGDPQVTKDLWQEFQHRQQYLQRLEGQLKGLLAGVAVQDSKELSQKLLETDNQVQFLLGQIQELSRQHPGLPSFTQGAQLKALEEEYRQLEEEINLLTRKEEELKERDQELRRQQGYLEGQKPLNIAQGLEELAKLKEEKEALEFEVEALAIAYQELKSAIEDYNASYRERLAEQATHYFRLFTGTDREVMVTEDFSVKLMDQGKPRNPSQFSQGTRDQLFLALRLAIGDLLAEDMHLPFIFDDPFLNFDEQRLRAVMEQLQSLAGERQIFFLSHRQEFQSWGVPVSLRGGNQ